MLAQTPDDQGVAQDHPTQIGQSESAESSADTPEPDFSVPVHIIESPEDAERAAANQRQTQDHDAADLDAQRRAAIAAEKSADAAEWQKWPTIWQVGIGAVAAFGLIVSLILNYFGLMAARISAAAAISAVEEARKFGRLNAMAYVSIVKSTCIVDGSWLHLGFILENKGASIASKVRLFGGVRVYYFDPKTLPPALPKFTIIPFEAIGGLVEHGSQGKAYFILPHTSFDDGVFDLIGENSWVDLDCVVEWVDVFGEAHSARHILSKNGLEFAMIEEAKPKAKMISELFVSYSGPPQN